ncbi:MAG: translesion error-prone DNA polymerase V autoproteolytic subunit [Rikenellaceae bacterium]
MANFEKRDKEHTILDLFCSDNTTSVNIPYSSDGVSAGVPFHVEGDIDSSLDLNKELIRNPASTFFARVKGCSMIGAGIDDGDLLVVDRLVEPYDGCVAVCYVDGEFTVKRIKYEKEYMLLIAENPDYKPIKVTGDNDFTVWGVVRYVVKKF